MENASNLLSADPGRRKGEHDRSARTQWVKAVAEGWFQMLLGGWKAFGRLLVEAFWEVG